LLFICVIAGSITVLAQEKKNNRTILAGPPPEFAEEVQIEDPVPILAVRVVLAVFGVSLVIFVHELGHYWVARIFNLATPSFTVGIGPRVFQRRIGETDFVWRLLPFGGLVRFVDGKDDPQIAHLDEKCSRETLTSIEQGLLNPNAMTLSGVTRREAARERRNLERRVTSDRDV